jgi:hypothetical protein
MFSKPSELYLTVIDVFVLVLPGAILIALALFVSGPDLGWPRDADPGVDAWAALALGAYVIGHILSGIGSFFEDQFNRSPRGKRRREKEWKKHAELRDRAAEILDRTIGAKPIDPEGLRRWAAVLVFNAGGYGGANLTRKDADRRFCRNATAAFLLALLLKLLCLLAERSSDRSYADAVIAGALALFAALCMMRFLDQDKKFSRDAYESLIAMDRLGQLKTSAAIGHPSSPEEEK